MKITSAELNVIRFASEDVIATSGIIPITPTTGTFYIANGSGYNEFNGSFVNNGAGPYIITPSSSQKAYDSEERDGLMSGGSVTFYGVTIDMSDMAPIAKQYYDAFTYDGTTYYTTGASYYDQYWNQ